MIDDLLTSIQQLTQYIKKHQTEPPDTSRDSVYFIDTEGGSWVEIIYSGVHSKMSCKFYNTMTNHPKIKEMYDERHKGDAK